mgnify:CR=1 FL=1
MQSDCALDELETSLLAAHQSGDLSDLIRLYGEAAERAEAAGDIDRAAFFLTHAWIFALDAGDVRATELHSRLAAWGRVA